MGIWRPGTVQEEPEVVLVGWKVYEVESELWEGKSHHFVGYNVTLGEGRVSSKIEEFDKTTMTGITSSGRTYKLDGQPSYDPDGDYVWRIWSIRNKLTDVKEVSQDYIDN